MEYPSLDKPTAGAFRFNTDSSQMEIYDGNQWTGVLSTSPEQQTGGTRGLFGGGYTTPSHTKMNAIDYINVTTTGDAADFGDLAVAKHTGAGCANAIIGVIGNGSDGPAVTNEITYIRMATLGNSVDFGDSTQARYACAGMSSRTRGVWAGGYGANPYPLYNIIDYV